jgi:hypothetical protein
MFKDLEEKFPDPQVVIKPKSIIDELVKSQNSAAK